MGYFKRGVQVLNPGVTTGEGLDAWLEWLIQI